MRTLLLICLILFPMMTTPSHASGHQPAKDGPRIAPWYGGRAGAVSLRFDDNLESHLDIAIPVLNGSGIKGTFMVSPGRSSFKKRGEHWLKEVPSMGHQLGNHTMHHRGAANLSEARFEIGEAAKILREAAGNPGGLLVFASGGGKSWGGKRWSETGEDYREIPVSLGMIDLYDGSHPYVNVTGDASPVNLIRHVDLAAGEGRHQAFTFHGVGKPSLRDTLRKIIRGKDLTISEKNFREFIERLHDRSDNVWIAPLGDILKYEKEYASAGLEGLVVGRDRIGFQLVVDTDPTVYDHPLTAVLPWPETAAIKVTQNGKPVPEPYGVNGKVSFDLSPVNSFVEVVLVP